MSNALHAPAHKPALAWRDHALLALVFAFPITAMLVPHGPTSIYALLALLGIVYGLRDRPTLAPAEKSVLIGFAGIFVTAALSLINADDLDSSFSKLGKYARFLWLIPLYFLIRQQGPRVLYALLAGLGVASILLAATAWWQTEMTGLPRAAGIRHPILFGDFSILVALLLAVATILLSRRPWHFLAGGLLSALTLYASLASETRNAWLVVPFAIPLLLWLLRRRVKRQAWLAMAGIALVFTGLLAVEHERVLKGFERGISEINLYLEGHTERTTSWGLRINMWRNSLVIFQNNPVLGTGLGDYTGDMKQLIETGYSHANHEVMYKHEAHSAYIHALAVTGVLGLLALLVGTIALPLWAFLLAWGTAADPMQRLAALGGAMTTLAFAVFGIGTAWAENNTFVSIYLVMTIILLGQAHRPRVTSHET